MEDGNKALHSEPATCTTTAELTGEDLQPPAAADGGGEHKDDKNPEDTQLEIETAVVPRESKRRKLCPSALEKCESIIINSCSSSNPSNCFSFTFDPKFSCGASTPEVTPKFGSFNLVAKAAVSTGFEVKSEQEGEKKKDDKEEEVEELKGKRKFLEILGSVDDDGISADYFEEGSNVFL